MKRKFNKGDLVRLNPNKKHTINYTEQAGLEYGKEYTIKDTISGEFGVYHGLSRGGGEEWYVYAYSLMGIGCKQIKGVG